MTGQDLPQPLRDRLVAVAELREPARHAALLAFVRAYPQHAAAATWLLALLVHRQGARKDREGGPPVGKGGVPGDPGPLPR